MASYLRLRQICLVAAHLEPVIPDISEIMGLNVCYRDGNVAKYGLENALLPVDTILLEVVAPIQQGTAAGRFLDKTGGRGGYMAIFCCDDPDERARHARQIGVRVAKGASDLMSALTFRVSDIAKVLDAAKAKGHDVSADSFLLGGVSFRLAA